MNVPSLNDSDVQSLIDGLKLQIKCFNDGVTNTLSETMEEAKMALNNRKSDGKTFMISANNPIRSKLKYQLNKAISVKSTQQSPVEITSQRRQFFQEDVDKFGKQWQDTFVFYSCSHCVYTGPRTEFFNIDDCDPYILLLYKLVKQEYFAKLRSSGIREIRKAADVSKGQLTAGGAFPGFQVLL